MFRRTNSLGAHLGPMPGLDVPESMLRGAVEAIEQVRAGHPDTSIELQPHCYLKARDVIEGLRLEDFLQPTLSVVV